MKKSILICFFLCMINAIAQSTLESLMQFSDDLEENLKIYEQCKNFENSLLQNPPIGEKWWYETDVILNGKRFRGSTVDDSYREQDGWTYIHNKDRNLKDKDGRRISPFDSFGLLGGYLRQHYWLYDTYMYNNGNPNNLYDNYIPAWIESLGLTIEFNKIQDLSPNLYLDENVKSLMKQRNCDFAVTILNYYGSLQNMFRQYNNHHFKILIINYDKKKNVFSTRIIPCGDEYYFQEEAKPFNP